MSRQLDYYHRNAEARNEATKLRHSKPEGRASVLLSSCRGRARRNKLEFDLTKKWILERLRGNCELTGIEFNFEEARGPKAPSVDRIDSTKGYTKDNCRVILWSLNCAFSTWGAEDFSEIALAWLSVTEQKLDNPERKAA